MWRSHIPKLEIIFPSEVLVSSERPYRNVTFDNVLVRQMFFFNRALHAFGLRDMKMTSQRWVIALVFAEI